MSIVLKKNNYFFVNKCTVLGQSFYSRQYFNDSRYSLLPHDMIMLGFSKYLNRGKSSERYRIENLQINIMTVGNTYATIKFDMLNC